MPLKEMVHLQIQQKLREKVGVPESSIILTSWWLNQPIWKHMIVKLDDFSRDRAENKKLSATTILVLEVF